MTPWSAVDVAVMLWVCVRLIYADFTGAKTTAVLCRLLKNSMLKNFMRLFINHKYI